MIRGRKVTGRSSWGLRYLFLGILSAKFFRMAATVRYNGNSSSDCNWKRAATALNCARSKSSRERRGLAPASRAPLLRKSFGKGLPLHNSWPLCPTFRSQAPITPKFGVASPRTSRVVRRLCLAVNEIALCEPLWQLLLRMLFVNETFRDLAIVWLSMFSVECYRCIF